MTEEQKRRGRLATALIAGPAVTVGMLGAGVAPALASGEAEPEDAEVTDSDATDSSEIEDSESGDQSDPADADESETDAEEIVDEDEDDAEDDEDEDDLSDDESDEDEEDVSTFQEDGDDEDDDDESSESASDAEWSVEGPVITGTGLPEGTYSVTIEAPSGETASRSVDEDGTVTIDTTQLVDILELGFGEQTLALTWEWYDDDFQQQQDSAEVTVTAVPPLQTGEDLSSEEIAGNLIGDGTGIENVETIGQGVQIGVFDGWDALGIPAGIVLSTGDLLEAWGAVTGRTSGSISQDLEGSGDSDLESILEATGQEGASTHDASGLEFTFVPEQSYVQFSYVFSSTEYPNASTFNDVFAFLINGENYAVFDSEDGETLPVAIQTINNETNSDLYNDNPTDEEGQTPYETGVRGFTNVLTFTAPVTPGEANTLKLVIADTNDGIFDSLVFLASGSFEQLEGPVAEGSETTTQPGSAVSGDFILDTNIDDPEWTIDIVDGIDEEAGELEVDGTSWTFTPAEGFTGEVSFSYTANDGQLTTSPATVTIVVEDPDEDDDDDDDDATDPGEDGDDDSTDDETPGDDDSTDDDAPGDDDDDSQAGDDGDAPAEDGDTIELTLDTDEVAPGGEITVVGEGFESEEDVEFELNPDLGSFPADEDGVVTAVLTIPEDTEPGEYTLTATGETGGLSGSASITVVEPVEADPAGDATQDEEEAATGGAGDSDLAQTGTTARDAGIISGLLLLLGGALAAVGYKNRLGRRETDAEA